MIKIYEAGGVDNIYLVNNSNVCNNSNDNNNISGLGKEENTPGEVNSADSYVGNQSSLSPGDLIYRLLAVEFE
jgi:hypothetical protein